MSIPGEGYSIADQVARFENAKAENSKRFLDISSVFDGSYLKDLRVLLTGCNRGLGLALARELAAHGAHVTCVVRATSPELDALIAADPGRHTLLTGCEVCDEKTLASVLGKGVTEPVDIVINNAGYFYDKPETIDTLNFEEQLKQINICALGPLRITSILRNNKLLKPNGQSRVAIITSQAGSAAWRSTQNKDKGGDYGHHMSRAACNMAGVLMAEELRPEGIPIGLLHPGFNRTDMTKKYEEIWDKEGAVDISVGAKRVLHEIRNISLETTGRFVNCEDGLLIPW